MLLAVGIAALGLLVAAPEAEAAPTLCELDFMLVFDTSGSMAGARLTAAKDGSKGFLATLDTPEDQSGLVDYNTAATLDKRLDPDHARTIAEVDRLVADGHTFMADGIRQAHEEIKANGRPTVRQIMVVLADGASTDDPVPFATQAKNDGIEIFGIGIGPANDQQMKAVASDPDSTYYKKASTTSAVKDAFQEILLEVHPLCADFSATSGCVGMPIEFAFTGTLVPPTALARGTWDFGDGSAPLALDPWSGPTSHAFLQEGTYEVTLNVTDSRGQVDEVRRDVDIGACPVADFACAPLDSPWLRASFTDLSTNGPVVAWSWDFDGLGTSDEASPTFDFPAKGWYQVRLQVWDEDGHTGSVVKECFADLNRPPIIVPVPVQVVYAGQSVAFTVTGHDPDDDDIWFTWHRGSLPTQAKFQEPGFSWKTGPGDEGLHGPLRFVVHDWQYQDETSTFVAVLPVPDAAGPKDSDLDGDGAPDGTDNCDYIYNPDQRDTDGNGVGDACEGMEFEVAPPPAVTQEETVLDDVDEDVPDRDRDGVPDTEDTCATVPNRDQSDMDRDGVGDLCDPDIDGDGVANLDAYGRLLDNCPWTSNPQQLDKDHDGFGDTCDGDVDADSVQDGEDNCMWIPNALQTDSDGNGMGDACQVLSDLEESVVPGVGNTPIPSPEASETALMAAEAAAWPWLAAGGLVLIIALTVGTVASQRRP